MAPSTPVTANFVSSLYGSLIDSASNDQNVFISPTSLAIALGMTLPGADKNTAAEMRKVLGFGEGDAYVEGFHNLLAKLGDSGDAFQLEIANRLFGTASLQWKDEFRAITKDKFLAEFETVNFAQAEAARDTINKWVASKTSERITDLIGEGVLDHLTILVLVNAVYFKGSWQIPFQERSTLKKPFHVTPENQVDAHFMRNSIKSPYASHAELDDGTKAVQLAYNVAQGESPVRASMLLLLPPSHDASGSADYARSVASLISSFDSKKNSNSKFNVNLPKFELSCKHDIKEHLIKLGMVDAFSDNADFTKMCSDRDDIYLSHVLHQTFVLVNEHGTEAAGATAVVAKSRSRPLNPPPTYEFDRPFVVVIRHEETGTPLFVGRISNPSN